MKQAILIAGLSLILFTGCAQGVNFDPASSGFSASSGIGSGTLITPTDDCASSVIKSKYIVLWTNGHITRESADDDAAFSAFVETYKDQISIAEHDYKVAIPEKAQSLMQVQTVTQADNWGVIRVDADKVWSQGNYGAGVTVAVVDTGIDRTHPQLANQLYLNPGENGLDAQGRNKASNGIDDDINGFVDDWNGWNFVTGSNSPLDDNGHGTHVSGIISAEHSDVTAHAAAYVEGMAPQAKLLPLKFLDDQGEGNMSDAVSAIQMAVAQGARVINASWGGTTCSATLQQAISDLVAKNVLFVAASGNDGVDLDQNARYPASFSFLSQLTVGATGQFDAMASYSNYGTNVVELFAPGTLIISTFPGGTMAALSGTSMATPFVTGAAALLLGVHPTATLLQIRNAIFASVTKNAQYLNETQGRLDLTALLTDFH